MASAMRVVPTETTLNHIVRHLIIVVLLLIYSWMIAQKTGESARSLGPPKPGAGSDGQRHEGGADSNDPEPHRPPLDHRSTPLNLYLNDRSENRRVRAEPRPT